MVAAAMGPIKTGAEARLRKRQVAYLTSPSAEPEAEPDVGVGVRDSVFVFVPRPIEQHAPPKPDKLSVAEQLQATTFAFALFMSGLILAKRGVLTPLAVSCAAACRALVLASNQPLPDII